MKVCSKALNAVGSQDSVSGECLGEDLPCGPHCVVGRPRPEPGVPQGGPETGRRHPGMGLLAGTWAQGEMRQLTGARPAESRLGVAASVKLVKR